MNKILVIAEHNGTEINGSTNKCVTCASKIENCEIDVVVFSKNGDILASKAAKIDGVNKVIKIDGDINEFSLAAIIAPQIKHISSDYSHIFGPSTTFGKDLMPRVAALLDTNQISDIMEVITSHSFKRPTYAGNAILTIEVAKSEKIIATIRTASFTAAENNNNANIDTVSHDIQLPDHTKYISLQSGKSDRPDLQTAKKVVSGGRALASEENFKIIYELADSLGAGAGASRAAVDAGYVPNEMQVGQTGKIIAPDLYLAIGISGAIQHLTGIKDAGTIVAINKDEDAPIFEVADIGLVGDLFKIIPELKAALDG
ncbi:MAG: electron transfer flavoprotein alpha subunit [Woeseiaceae bacterium]|jgi:electron transfer flavoprotein alpha subunit|tara:strand:+ start:19211 stop:20155 length:945 start_codon:yes stop_codon:yes gene_type:complete